MSGEGEDRGVQADERVVCAGGTVSAVPAGSVGCDVGADEAEDGGEGDQAGVDAGGGGGSGGRSGRDVVDEQQCPCFLAGEVRGLAAKGAPRAPDGFLQMKERDFNRPPLIPLNLKSSLASIVQRS